jgi:hypothetical protein
MIYIWLNLGAILLATAASLAVGAVWLRLAGPRPPITPGMCATAFICVWWLAAILAGALILAPEEAPRWAMVLGSPLVIWAGFVLPAVVLVHRLRQLAWRFALSDSLLWLLMMVAQAVILELVGLVPPPRALG